MSFSMGFIKDTLKRIEQKLDEFIPDATPKGESIAPQLKEIERKLDKIDKAISETKKTK